MLSLETGTPSSLADWEEAASHVLRRSGRMSASDPDGDVWSHLSRSTLDGVEVTCLGTSRSVVDLPSTSRTGVASRPRTDGATPRGGGWDVRSLVLEQDPARAARVVLDELENGATSLWLSIPTDVDVSTALEVSLQEVYLDLAPVVLDAPGAPIEAAAAFVDLLGSRGVQAAPGTSLGGDPLGRGVRWDEPAGDLEDEVVDLTTLARSAGVLALTIDATVVHDRGATDGQELAYSLAVGAHYLRILERSGVAPDDAARLVEFRYAVTDEQFDSIAKLRAARCLWERLLQLCGVRSGGGQLQHAVTSRAMTTRYDPWVNILRGTVGAFAAGVGGASAITVLPFDNALGSPEALSRRVARNTTALLVHESSIARVADPAGGAFAVERLTADLATNAWAQFQRIETEGGVRGLREPAGFLDRVARSRERRADLVARRRRPITGVSEFPNLDEHLPVRRPHPVGAAELTVRHWAADFEALRDDPAPLPVFVATMGRATDHTPRATFAHNLLAAGGIAAVLAGPTSNAGELIAAFGGQRVVCLAGSDTAYGAWGVDAAVAVRAAGASYVILAGQPSRAGVPEDAVDDWCVPGIDAITFLRRIRKELAR